jgi:hypothetical protein
MLFSGLVSSLKEKLRYWNRYLKIIHDHFHISSIHHSSSHIDIRRYITHAAGRNVKSNPRIINLLQAEWWRGMTYGVRRHEALHFIYVLPVEMSLCHVPQLSKLAPPLLLLVYVFASRLYEM